MGPLTIGLVVLFLWIVGKVATSAAAGSDSGSAQPSPSTRPSGGSEEERMRKFLEALGLPPDGAPPTPPARQSAPPLPRSAERPAPRVKPVPPIVANAPRKPSAQLKPTPRPPAPVPEPQTFAVENIRLPDLHVPETPAFETLSSRVNAVPAGALSTRYIDKAISEEAAPSFPVSDETFAMLRSPGALRAAILAKEILGPPRSLQSSDFDHSFQPL